MKYGFRSCYQNFGLKLLLRFFDNQDSFPLFIVWIPWSSNEFFKAFYAWFADAILRIAITNTDSNNFQLSYKTLTSRIFAACRILLCKIDWENLDAFFNFLSTLEYFVLSHTTLKSACLTTICFVKLLLLIESWYLVRGIPRELFCLLIFMLRRIQVKWP